PLPSRLDANALGVPVLEVEGLAAQLGATGHLWYGRPSDSLSVVAVTGTNGKTSTVQWIAAALNAARVPCGAIGTLGVMLPDGTSIGGELTTPDGLSMHSHLAALRQAGGEGVGSEASASGVARGRLDAVPMDGAAFSE